jgi:hypothetical protein
MSMKKITDPLIKKNNNNKQLVITPSNNDNIADRPFTLPSGEFKPKQSLGQNFLSDQIYVLKIVDAFSNIMPFVTSSKSNNNNNNTCMSTKVIEIGPGPGILLLLILK